MKTLLALLIAAVGSGYYAVNALERVYAAKAQVLTHPDTGQPTDAFTLGIEALTGQLTERRLAELEAALTHQERREPQGLSGYPLTVSVAPEAIAEPARASVVEAWADDAGRIFVRLADGTIAQRLASGELALIQPCNVTAIDSHGELP